MAHPAPRKLMLDNEKFTFPGHSRSKWLVTGVAGFIGSNLLETLLASGQDVVGLDNFSTGYRRNLDEVRSRVGESLWGRFEMIEGDIAEPGDCHRACKGVDYILHQAALGSVPRSMEDPVGCHRANVTGGLNMLVAARDACVKRFVYASSSAVYGDDPGLPKREEKTGKPLSPYAASKAIGEVYAQAFATAYGLPSIGLRYFNVFGPRQDPKGAYAAVIPQWTAALINGDHVYINGDGETSRDFCHISNVIQANLLAATTNNPDATNQVYNVAVGERCSLNELFNLLQSALRNHDPSLPERKPVYRDFRAGDVRHSLADIGKAQRLLGYAPTHRIQRSLAPLVHWYREHIAQYKSA
jgi:UDP-N-acetylglucosamine/UDP-N-acetylgalactosamine 4-epimerase